MENKIIAKFNQGNSFYILFHGNTYSIFHSFPLKQVTKEKSFFILIKQLILLLIL